MNMQIDVSQSEKVDLTAFWQKIHAEVLTLCNKEPFMLPFFSDMVLQHQTFNAGISHILAKKLYDCHLEGSQLYQLFLDVLNNSFMRPICSDDGEVTHFNVDISQAIVKDMEAFVERDPAVNYLSTPLLYFKGLQALAAYRISNYLWQTGQISTALFLQNRISEVYAVDIHPAATIGSGILIDHATSLVIGETAVVGNNVSMLHEVTLGGNGKERGDRHPKIAEGVLIGSGAKILGNVMVGKDAKIGAGSVVLINVKPHTTVAGIPAKYVGKSSELHPSLEMQHDF